MTRELAELIPMVLIAILLAYASYNYGYNRGRASYTRRKDKMDRFIDPKHLPKKMICNCCEKEIDTENEKVYDDGFFLICEDCYKHEDIEDE